MSATNHTTNYNLPQFIGTDKPTWLTDVNGAMSAIDTQMKANADSATSASTSATTANNAIGTLSNLNTETKTDLVSAVNEVNTNLGTVSGVASQASSDATNALTTANAVGSYLNFTQFKNYVKAEVSITGGTIDFVDSLNVVTNAEGTVGKVYGTIGLNCTNSNGFTISFPSALRPDSTINIAGVMWANKETDKNDMQISSFSIASDGTITVSKGSSWYNKYVRLNFVACVLFLKDFGDTPVGQ